MRKMSELFLLGMLASASLFFQACATQSASTAGEEHPMDNRKVAEAERIDEQEIKHIPPPEFSMTPTRVKPSMRAELAPHISAGQQSGFLTDVLFDFDRAVLRDDALPVLNANANFLKRTGTSRLLLEGRGDEIGTSSYNLVLGDSRAKHVKAYLHELGVMVDLETTSYGKDRPLCFRHDNDCRQMNRSVRFVIKE
ncbi:OmpA family protein [Petrachloros mirabilis]